MLRYSQKVPVTHESVVTLHTLVSRVEARALAFELSEVLDSNPEDVARLLLQARRPLSLVVPRAQAGRVLRVLRRAGLEAEPGHKRRRKVNSQNRLTRYLLRLSFVLLAALVVSAVAPFLPRLDLSSLFAGTDNAMSALPVREAPQPPETEVSPPPDTVGRAAEEEMREGGGVLEAESISENESKMLAGSEGNIGENSVEDGGAANREEPSLFVLATGAAPALREALTGTDPDVTDAYGQTPLMYAAGAGNLDAVEALLDAGALINARSGAGWTALMYAARDNPDVRVAEALFTAGGDPSLKNDEGQTPLDVAVKSGNQAFVDWLNEKLFRAAEDAPVASIRTLLKAGAAVENRDAYGQTPLMYAVHKNHKEAVSALLEAGADANARSRAGWTPLMYAARDAGADVAAALLEAGAENNARNGEGETARDLALIYNNNAVAELVSAASRARAARAPARVTVRAPAPPPAVSPARQAAAARAAEKAALFRCLQERIGCEDLNLP